MSKLNGCTHFSKTQDIILQECESTEDIKFKIANTKKIDSIGYEDSYKALIDELQSICVDTDFESEFNLVSKDGVLSLTRINKIVVLAEFYINNHKSLSKYNFSSLDKESINKLKQKLTNSIIKEFRSFVTNDGEIDYSKHPLLRDLFFKQKNLETSIRSKLNDKIKNGSLKDKVQFQSIDIINDRYVIPIKSDAFQNRFGKIVSRSETGSTLFVEPSSITNKNQDRIEILVEIQNTIATLESKFSKSLSFFLHDLRMILKVVSFIDEYNSRYMFTRLLNLSEPVIVDQPSINLINFFHPLIPNPVKNNIQINEDKNGIIISGPNTGGKTATLKAIAITQLLLRSGLFIPCEYGEVFPYEKIFYFGNDQQNLNEGLSSFSAEVKNYSELVSQLSDTNLILIDEIFNSTSSEEASALAVSLFDNLSQISKCHIIVSSHHQTLKTFLHQDDRFISAHVGFDLKSNSPTYKLYYGSPGSSQALNIFSSLTNNNALFKKIYDNSLRFLDNKIIHYEKLLESLSHKENELNELLKKQKDLNNHLRNQKKSMEGIIKLKIDERIKQTQSKLNKLISKAEDTLKAVKNGEINKIKKLDSQSYKINNELRSLTPSKDMPIENTSQVNLSIPTSIEVGNNYFCLKLDKTVNVKKVMGRNAQVQAGHFSLKVPLESLRDANNTSIKKDVKFVNSSVQRSRDTQLEYDCRGMRLDEFQSTVEIAISDLLLENIPYANIIHGHGTGILKKWLRKHIKNTKEIKIDSSDTGNDGETRIILV